MFYFMDFIERLSLGNFKREVYVIIFYFVYVYVCGVIVVVQSIRQFGLMRDFVIFVDENISGYYRSGFEVVGW